MDKVYVGIINYNGTVRITGVSNNREKTQVGIYRYYIFSQNIFSYVWNEYYSSSFEDFSEKYPSIVSIPNFRSRIDMHDTDDEINEEFCQDLTDLLDIQRYIDNFALGSSFIEEHNIL